MTSIVQEYIELTKNNKKIYGDKTVIFLMVGAFYEIYAIKKEENIFYGSSIEDISSICDLSISNKQMTHNTYPVYMCGFRDYTLDKYVIKMTDMGYTCLVYDQEPDGKKYKRTLSSIYSPGTVFLNNNNLSNNCACLWFHEHKNNLFTGISSIDILTGKTILYESVNENTKLPTAYDDIERFLSIYKPSELIIISPSKTETSHVDYIQRLYNDNSKYHTVYLDDNSIFSERSSNCEKQVYIKEIISNVYTSISYDIFNNLFLQNTISSQSFTYLLNFINDHNPHLIKNIQIPVIETFENNMLLANHSLKQLCVISNGTSKLSNLYNLLNYCKTPMGHRKLKDILLHPSCNIEYLKNEYNITEYLLKIEDFTSFFRSTLAGFKDFDKCYRQIILKRITPKSINDIYKNLLSTETLIKYIENYKELETYITSSMLTSTKESIHLINDFIERIFNLDKCNIDMLQFDVNIFNSGVYEEIDTHVNTLEKSEEELKIIINDINITMNKAENKTKQVEYIKMHLTEKSGLFLVMTKKRAELLKRIDTNNNYTIRKTSANNQYSIENKTILSLCDKYYKYKNKLKDIIQKYYFETLHELEQYSSNIYELSNLISILDILQNKTYIVDKYNYSKPILDDNSDKSYLDVKNLRHPLVEHIQQNELYVSNDISLGINDQDGVCLFGTNAVGKTCFIKSIGLNIIMAQSGFYVASSEFVYSPYKQLFTRILNNDNMFKGLSTFAVEMCELRTILTMANENSLILGDELCSGTENISAISIFMAGLEYLHNCNSSFIFATHFHEITDMEDIKQMNNLKMKHLSVCYDYKLKTLIYDRKIKDGPGESIYGLEVCKSLLLPDDFLNNAYEKRKKYLKIKDNLNLKKSIYNANKVNSALCEMCKKNISSEIHHLQYQKMANKNNYINDFHKNHTANLLSVCEECHNKIHKDNIQYVKKKSITGEINIIGL